MSIAKNLAKNLGGKWTYCYPSTWYCDDGYSRVVRCSAGVDEFDNSLGTVWYLYRKDAIPESAEKYISIPIKWSIFK